MRCERCAYPILTSAQQASTQQTKIPSLHPINDEQQISPPLRDTFPVLSVYSRSLLIDVDAVFGRAARYL